MNAPLKLRDVMPQTAAFIDDLRDAFGADEINALIRGGMNGLPTFWACEGGIEVGTRAVLRGSEISVAEMVIESEKWRKDANRKTAHR